MSDKLKLSFTLLDLWVKDQFDRAVDFYLGKELKFPKSVKEKMEMGKQWEEYIERTVKETGKLPPELGFLSVGKHQFQYRFDVALNDFVDLVGYVDLLDFDNSVIYDFKHGSTDIVKYSDSLQLPFYFLGLNLVGLGSISKGLLMAYDQYQKQNKTLLFWATKGLISDTKLLLTRVGFEIYTFFKSKDLLSQHNKFRKKRGVNTPLVWVD